MGYECISKTRPKARKEYRCIWCPEKILKGEIHIREVSKYDGNFQDHRWHPECLEACYKYIKETGEDTFYPHESKRGSTEEY